MLVVQRNEPCGCPCWHGNEVVNGRSVLSLGLAKNAAAALDPLALDRGRSEYESGLCCWNVDALVQYLHRSQHLVVTGRESAQDTRPPSGGVVLRRQPVGNDPKILQNLIDLFDLAPVR